MAPEVSKTVGNGVVNIAAYNALTDSSVIVGGQAEANATVVIWTGADSPDQDSLLVKANAQLMGLDLQGCGR